MLDDVSNLIGLTVGIVLVKADRDAWGAFGGIRQFEVEILVVYLVVVTDRVVPRLVIVHRVVPGFSTFGTKANGPWVEELQADVFGGNRCQRVADIMFAGTITNKSSRGVK